LQSIPIRRRSATSAASRRLSSSSAVFPLQFITFPLRFTASVVFCRIPPPPIAIRRLPIHTDAAVHTSSMPLPPLSTVSSFRSRFAASGCIVTISILVLHFHFSHSAIALFWTNLVTLVYTIYILYLVTRIPVYFYPLVPALCRKAWRTHSHPPAVIVVCVSHAYPTVSIITALWRYPDPSRLHLPRGSPTQTRPRAIPS